MISALFWLAVGAFIGWQFPQPEWAKKIEAGVREAVVVIADKFKGTK